MSKSGSVSVSVEVLVKFVQNACLISAGHPGAQGTVFEVSIKKMSTGLSYFYMNLVVTRSGAQKTPAEYNLIPRLPGFLQHNPRHALIEDRHRVMTQRAQIVCNLHRQVFVDLYLHSPDTGNRLSSRARSAA